MNILNQAEKELAETGERLKSDGEFLGQWRRDMDVLCKRIEESLDQLDKPGCISMEDAQSQWDELVAQLDSFHAQGEIKQTPAIQRLKEVGQWMDTPLSG